MAAIMFGGAWLNAPAEIAGGVPAVA